MAGKKEKLKNQSYLLPFRVEVLSAHTWLEAISRYMYGCIFPFSYIDRFIVMNITMIEMLDIGFFVCYKCRNYEYQYQPPLEIYLS